MKTDEFVQLIAAQAVFWLTWELWISNYFHTRSEKTTFLAGRGPGKFTTTTMMITFIKIISFGMVAYYFFP